MTGWVCVKKRENWRVLCNANAERGGRGPADRRQQRRVCTGTNTPGAATFPPVHPWAERGHLDFFFRLPRSSRPQQLARFRTPRTWLFPPGRVGSSVEVLIKAPDSSARIVVCWRRRENSWTSRPATRPTSGWQLWARHPLKHSQPSTQDSDMMASGSTFPRPPTTGDLARNPLAAAGSVDVQLRKSN